MSAVLSTRRLQKNQLDILLDAGIIIEDYDAIAIKHLDIDIPGGFTKYIFTSKNGVKGYLRNRNSENRRQKSVACYCVGEKTRSLLEENGLIVLKMAQNASELGDFVAKNYKNESFLIFAGNRNRPELREIFDKNNIPFKEVNVYETHLRPRKFEKNYDYILFYSPSGVKSFVEMNPNPKSAALCIGETTAEEAGKHFERVVIADNPTTDAVLDKLLEIYPNPAKS